MVPAVSIIIPCYNQGHFLAQAVGSVLKQSFSNWEAFIVDDGSTDETSSVASGFADARIHYIYQDNRGLAAARNAGIRLARAETIALLDSDDVWEADYLDRMVESLSNHTAVAAYCGYRYIDVRGNTLGGSSLKIVPPEAFHRALLREGNWLIPSAVVFRRLNAETLGLFDESLKALEDTDLWIRLSERDPFVGVDGVLVGYRLHESSMSKDPERMVSACRQLTEKIYGLPEGDHGPWGTDKKNGYTKFYSYGALAYLAQRDAKKSAEYFCQLFRLSKERALSMGMWRAFARVHLPSQHRGRPFLSEDCKKAEESLAGLLDAISGLAAEKNLLHRDLLLIKSHAWLALADESARSHFYVDAGAWLWKTIKCSPFILLSRPLWGSIFRGVTSSCRSKQI
jgi:glycosyltransferase involved in cell wall biosynthesis